MQHQIAPSSHIPAVIRILARNVSATGRGRKQAISMAFNCVLVVFALWVAYALRFGTVDVDVRHLSMHFLLLSPITVFVFAGLGVYRWIVRSSTFGLFLQAAKGVLISATLLLGLLYQLPPEGVNSRSVFIIDGLVLGAAWCLVRLIWKGCFSDNNKGVPIAIFGAGAAGKQLAAMLSGGSESRTVCLIDDDESLVGTTIMGTPVLDGRALNLLSQLARLEASEIVIAIPSVDSTEYSDIYNRLEQLDIPFKTSPSFVELVLGQAAINEILEVSVTDILGRNQVVPDPVLLQDAVRGKSILVPGGGGSIGSELCRQGSCTKSFLLTKAVRGRQWQK